MFISYYFTEVEMFGTDWKFNMATRPAIWLANILENLTLWASPSRIGIQYTITSFAWIGYGSSGFNR
jgi:hypothetical protein